MEREQLERVPEHLPRELVDPQVGRDQLRFRADDAGGELVQSALVHLQPLVANAARARLNQPVNIVAPGAITTYQASRRGRRIPLPIIGPEWALARRIAYLAGAPVPDHVLETLHRGRLADNSLARELLGFAPTTTTSDVIDELYSWPGVVHTGDITAGSQVA